MTSVFERLTYVHTGVFAKATQFSYRESAAEPSVYFHARSAGLPKGRCARRGGDIRPCMTLTVAVVQLSLVTERLGPALWQATYIPAAQAEGFASNEAR